MVVLECLSTPCHLPERFLFLLLYRTPTTKILKIPYFWTLSSMISWLYRLSNLLKIYSNNSRILKTTLVINISHCNEPEWTSIS